VKDWKAAREHQDQTQETVRATTQAREKDRDACTRVRCKCGSKGMRYVELYDEYWSYRPEAKCPVCGRQWRWWL